jgi:hypothetical protein
LGSFIKPKVVVIIMISINKDYGTGIDWNALDRCWADRYEEEYGHYFSDLSYIDTTIQLHNLTGIEASADTYI